MPVPPHSDRHFGHHSRFFTHYLLTYLLCVKHCVFHNFITFTFIYCIYLSIYFLLFYLFCYLNQATRPRESSDRAIDKREETKAVNRTRCETLHWKFFTERFLNLILIRHVVTHNDLCKMRIRISWKRGNLRH